jgi:signal transduction histidine kinase
MLEQTAHSVEIFASRLGQSKIFADLCQADLMAIAAFCYEETFEDDAAILKEGDPADKLFIVQRGKIALEKMVQLGRHSTPRNATIQYLVSGMAAGFSALARPHVYSTSGICVEPTRVITVDGPALRDYLASNPAAGYKVMSTLTTLISGRYRHATSTLTYFLSVVSHELRSPLAAIENYLQVMLAGYSGDLNPKQERMIKRCVIRVTDLRSQIGDVVDLARMRPEQIQADFAWFDLSEIGTQAIEDVRLASAERNIKVKVEAPPVFEPVVGAPRRMRQVFSNLLYNAIRYSPSDSTIIFKAWFEPESVFFSVEDQGPGIPEEDLPHIFKDFFRASNVEGAPGMGLGLAIAKKIMEAHEGQILVENIVEDSTAGKVKGTRFIVIIPRNLKTPEMQQTTWLEQGEKV